VAVHQDDLVKSVAGNLAARLVQQVVKHAAAIRNCSGLVPGLEDLTGKIKREDHCVLASGSSKRNVARGIDIGAHGQMLRVLFNHPHGDNADALCQFGRLFKICRGKFFPGHSQILILRPGCLMGLRLGLRLRLKLQRRLGLRCLRLQLRLHLRLCCVKGLSLWLGLQVGQR